MSLTINMFTISLVAIVLPGIKISGYVPDRSRCAGGGAGADLPGGSDNYQRQFEYYA